MGALVFGEAIDPPKPAHDLVRRRDQVMIMEILAEGREHLRPTPLLLTPRRNWCNALLR